jgi:hypothetical protein
VLEQRGVGKDEAHLVDERGDRRDHEIADDHPRSHPPQGDEDARQDQQQHRKRHRDRLDGILAQQRLNQHRDGEQDDRCTRRPRERGDRPRDDAGRSFARQQRHAHRASSVFRRFCPMNQGDDGVRAGPGESPSAEAARE